MVSNPAAYQPKGVAAIIHVPGTGSGCPGDMARAAVSGGADQVEAGVGQDLGQHGLVPVLDGDCALDGARSRDVHSGGRV